jgi:hypothetical protein
VPSKGSFAKILYHCYLKWDALLIVSVVDEKRACSVPVLLNPLVSPDGGIPYVVLGFTPVGLLKV